MRRIAAAAIVIGACSSPAPPPIAPKPAPPVKPFPAAPEAMRLPHVFEPTEYRVQLAVLPQQLSGTVEIIGDVREPTDVIWLHGVDLRVSRATATHDATTVELAATPPRDDELLGLLAGAPLAPGRWTLTLAYTAQVQELQPPVKTPFPQDRRPTGAFHRVVDGKDYVYTQAEPSDARRYVPCIDEPDRKVPWKVTLETVGDAIAIGNAPIVRETQLAGGRRRFELAPTMPMPSYLLAFAVGPFEFVDAGTSKAGVPIRIAVPHGHTGEAASAARMTARIMDGIVDWLGVPFPYPKLDFVAAPHLALGGMENPGLITVNDEWLYQTDETHPWAWITLASHEIAHHWFGDLVTPRWWDDIWLNEAFAAWISERILADVGEIRDRDPVAQSQVAMQLLKQSPKPLRVPVTTKAVMEEAISFDYRTGSALLDLIEAHVGAPQMKRAIQAYLRNHAHGIATTADFTAAVDAEAGHPLAPTIAAYLDGKGVATVGANVTCANGAAELALTTSANAELPVCFAYGRDGKRVDTCVQLQSDQRVPLPSCPTWWLSPAGSPPPYLVTWPPTQPDAALRGWASLATIERRRVFEQLVEPAQIVAALPALLASNDAPAIADAARQLLELDKLVPDELHPRIDAWIRTTLAARSGSVTLRKASGDERTILQLLALAGDEPTRRDAIDVTAHRAEVPLAVRVTAQRIAAYDRAGARTMLQRAKELGTYALTEVADAVAQSRTGLDTFAENAALIEPLDKFSKRRVLLMRCDLGKRAMLGKLATDLLGEPGAVIGWAERCIEERAKVAAAFRAWPTK